MATQKPEMEPNKKEGSVKDRLSETLETLKKHEKVEKIYTESNTRDTIAYILMIIGIIISLFHPFYGGLIVGILGGLYFSVEIMQILKDLNQTIERQGMVRSLIAGGVIIALFIAAPSIFIGVVLAIAGKMLLMSEPTKQP